jgi:hypothetical protein
MRTIPPVSTPVSTADTIASGRESTGPTVLDAGLQDQTHAHGMPPDALVGTPDDT